MGNLKNDQIVQAWLQEIGAALNITLTLDPNGMCSMLINGHPTTLQVSKLHPTIHLYAPLINLPKNDFERAFQLMAKALTLNAFQAHTHGGAIAVLPGEGCLIFCHTISTEHYNAERLSSTLAHFTETIADLKAQLLEESDPSSMLQPENGRISAIKA